MATEGKEKPSLIIKIAVRGGILFFLVLACMRFYAGYLEQEVAVISRAIERLSLQEMSINQQLSALKSPNKIFNYCRDNLKMNRSTNVYVIKNNE
jgi:hypothetical protein